MYREFRPPPHLRSSIACVWIRSGGDGSVRVMPDACTDIVWREGKGAVVAGPDTGHWFSQTEVGETIVGVRFLPGAGGPALSYPLEELRDQRVKLAELGLGAPGQLEADVDPADAPKLLAALAAEMTAAGPPDRGVQAAVVALMDPRRRVQPLATELGFSERQLHRRFLSSVGYGPKTLQRVLRLRRFLAAAPSSLADAAIDAGYSDQAHLTRECRRLTGLSPAQLLASSGSTGNVLPGRRDPGGRQGGTQDPTRSGAARGSKDAAWRSSGAALRARRFREPH
jgi:AraC-like DNA-binding protein